MQRSYHLVIVVLLAASHAAAASLDAQLVGTWDEHVIDAVSRLHLSADNTMFTTVDSRIMRRGTWRTEGRTLIIDEQLTVSSHKRQHHRATIFELTRERLVTGRAGPEVTFTRVR